MLNRSKLIAGALPLLLAAGSALAQGTPKTVTVGWGALSVDAPEVVVAIDKGYIKEAGLELKLVPFQSGRDGFEALIGGQLDVNVMTEFPAVVGAMRKQPFAVLAVLSRFKANRLITTAAAGIASTADLAGKKIGLPVGTNAQFQVDEDLKAAGVKAQLVNLTPPDLAPALLRGDVDAIATFPSLFAGAKRTLGERYRDLPVSPYATTFMLVASRDFLAKGGDTPAKLLGALAQAADFIKADPAGAQEIVAKAAGRATTPEAIRADWANSSYEFGLDPQLLDLMVRQGAWVRERGMVKDMEPTAALFRAAIAEGPLKAAAPASVTLP